MPSSHDIAIIGGGPGGYVAALKAAQLGASVALVEKAHLGGTCLNNGCIPSKALLASGELLHHIQHAADLGIDVAGPVGFNWPKIQARKDGIIQSLRNGIQALLRGRKVTIFRGTARLDGPGRIAVEKPDGPAETLTAQRIILATGSTPSRIPGWPADQTICTSDEALHWKELPASVLIVGGGVIGCEFACMLQPFGVQVTVVEMLPRLLPNMDGQLGAELEKILRKRGIAIHTSTKVEDLKVDGAGAGATATLSGGQRIAAEKVLVATGRRPSTAGIGLESVGLGVERGFLRVDDRMRTSVKDYWCIGDANGRCLLAHAASAQGIVAVENALGHESVMSAPVPNCVYTFPEIGSVGLSQEEAAERKLPIAIGLFQLSHLGKAMAAADNDGFVKVLRHRETNELLGVHMLGHSATECIAAAGAMLHSKATVQELADVVFAHPTMSESIRESAEDALGAGLHTPARKIVRVKV